ncbi:succinate dehydrogenase cytochrome b subunit [Amycolatopsis rhizosphaerae]|uniref:Succinate dehydrogenase cytochrome b subunit n=1 Tax=Amycolatopsis rhizosphaerae TaxID=2053003 RepID=A0A558DGP9_9PSEU|nr:succinate dehydrogenase cytochrome b subunit [Amycolatopsis rhizosphaerae]TVT60207.1 succinate dehydrogenase cytochrome b subunit [Amycolatopsis rhizosphaerae]
MAIATPALYRSTVGKKAVMAVTGGILVLFLIAHMAGNLKIFLGASDFDHYSLWLRTIGEPALPHRWFLSGLEIVLGVSVIGHMWAAITLARTARLARPVRYAATRKSQANGYAVRTMRYGGVIIALYVIWHLLDLTAGAVNPAGGNATPYAKVVADFAPSHWYITVFYVVAVVLVGLHLRHGIRSAFQTLGLAGARRYTGYDRLAAVVAALVVVGFLAVPISVTFGWVK